LKNAEEEEEEEEEEEFSGGLKKLFLASKPYMA
jgi:hypothetical protein